MSFKISGSKYAAMFGPTTGDKVRLADTSLVIEVEKDFTVYGDECKFGGGKTLRDGMGQSVKTTSADGDLDQTEFFGDVKYENATHRFEFTANQQSDFLTLYSRVKNALHGRKKRIILDDDPLYYYIGRVFIDKHTDEKGIATIDVEADCEPYKYKQDQT